MENRINVAELLKNCPSGMELDCNIFRGLEFDRIDENNGTYPIIGKVKLESGYYNTHTFTEYGCYSAEKYSKCVIFPKGKTTWEGFVPPCQFKDGDVVALDTKEGTQLFIFKEYIYNHDYVKCYMMLDCGGEIDSEIGDYYVERFATEKEKQKLFKVIRDHGYRWNTETKALEELIEPEFNVGDWIIRNNKYTGIPVKVVEFNGYYSCELNGEVVNLTRNDVHNNFHLWTIDDAKDGDVLFHSDSASNGIFIFKEIVQRGTSQKVICYCDYDSEDGFCLGENHTCCWTNSKILHPATEEQCNLLFQKMKKAGYKWNAETKTLEKLLVKPWFKVGDKITNGKTSITIGYIDDEYYYEVGRNIATRLFIKNQDEWKLIPKRFDITTLKSFESKVLVRHNKDNKWTGSFFSFIDRDLHSHCYKFVTTADKSYPMMIPYKGNEYLLGKTEDCQDFYKIWE